MLNFLSVLINRERGDVKGEKGSESLMVFGQVFDLFLFYRLLSGARKSVGKPIDILLRLKVEKILINGGKLC
ncbi:MAG: hypothetical protein PHW72_01330 [Candidatus Pacebacteria bacterium]|nr:hypothetical protein [Candidatus Paceibacterota bacterium]